MVRLCSLLLLALTTIEMLLEHFLVERFYGALTGLNKTATAEQLGEELVQGWRGSLRSRPPAIDEQNQVSDFVFNFCVYRKVAIRLQKQHSTHSKIILSSFLRTKFCCD